MLATEQEETAEERAKRYMFHPVFSSPFRISQWYDSSSEPKNCYYIDNGEYKGKYTLTSLRNMVGLRMVKRDAYIFIEGVTKKPVQFEAYLIELRKIEAAKHGFKIPGIMCLFIISRQNVKDKAQACECRLSEAFPN